MKTLKLITIILVALTSLQGCFATSTGYMLNSASLSQPNFRYIKTNIRG